MAFRAHLKVRFADIDNAGIVYYPRFLDYFHIALEELFSNELGIDYATVLHRHRFGFPTVHLESDFRRPLRFGDRIQVEVRVLKIGRTSITWGYTTYLSDEEHTLVVTGHNVTVCLDLDRFVKMEIPSWFRKVLEDYQARCQD